MPKNSKAIFQGDDQVYQFPEGTVLIKTFFYNDVLPKKETKIIETRLLINQKNGWQAYNYIWNNLQTEAYLDHSGIRTKTPITWVENGNVRNVLYEIPPNTSCLICHKRNVGITLGSEKIMPIGVKPQNLNTSIFYNGVLKNQLLLWQEKGYIDNIYNKNIVSTVNWRDTTYSLQLRARSYLDINCAHCHQNGSYCDYVPQRFNFSNQDSFTSGICLPPVSFVDGGPFVINSGNAENSELIIRMKSTQGSLMMPYIGRTLVDQEAIELLKNWINLMPKKCN